MDWILPDQNTDDIISWLIKSRNIAEPERFFNHSLEQIHDPFLMNDMDKAVNAIADAVKQKKKIFIHGDFDVDGIAATSIMWDFLFRKMNAEVLPYIPSRFDEGYGLSKESLNAIIEQGGEFVITVDCGVKDIDLITEYKGKLEILITDHHTVRTAKDTEESKKTRTVNNFIVSKDAVAVVHPKVSGKYPFTDICGAVVSWKVCCALNDKLGLGFDMGEYLDLVSLGTICDIMPLIDENRTMVKLGLQRLRETKNIGLRELVSVAGINLDDISEYHVGFVIGPRLNASGRLGHAMDAVRLLSTSSRETAQKIALSLNSLNLQRQDLTKEYIEKAEKMLKKQDINQKLLFVVGEEWPEGILGLIAGRLTEKYSRPVLVGSKNKEGLIKGSARSIAEYNISEALKLQNHHLLRHGGHAQAAGFSLNSENFESLYSALLEHANEKLKDTSLIKKLIIDAVLNKEEINLDIVEKIQNFAPFGQGNNKPVFAALNISPASFNFIGKDKNHIKFATSNKYGFVEFIGFDLVNSLRKLVDTTSVTTLPSFDFAGSLDINSWNGNRKVSFMIKDLRLAKK